MKRSLNVLASWRLYFQQVLNKARVYTKIHSSLTFLIFHVLIGILISNFRDKVKNVLTHVMSETSALSPLNNFFSDFDDLISQKRSLIIINFIISCVMLVFANVQFYTKIFITRLIKIDNRKITISFNVQCVNEL